MTEQDKHAQEIIVFVVITHWQAISLKESKRASPEQVYVPQNKPGPSKSTKVVNKSVN